MLAVLLGMSLLASPVAKDAEVPVYEVQLRLYQVEVFHPEGKKVPRQPAVKELARPTLATLSGKSCRFIVGGENPVPYSKPQTYEPCGAIVSLTVTRRDASSCLVQIDAEESTAQSTGNDLLVQSGTMVKVRGKMELNKKMSVRMAGNEEGKQTWLEFTVSEAKR